MGFFNWMWRPAASDAIPPIIYSVMNDDHVELYRIVAELQDDLGRRCKGETEQGFRQAHIRSVIDRLAGKAREHFQREEALMAACRYPESREHRAEHLMLLRSVETYAANLGAGGSSVTEEVGQYLKDWLTNHIRTTDHRLERFLISAVRRAGAANPGAFANSEAGWTAENTLLWASLHDSVARETVNGNRQHAQNTLEAMLERQRRDQKRQHHESVKEKLASDSRQTRAIYFE